MLLRIGGLASNAVADSALMYLNASGSYKEIGSILDIGWVIGFLMIALAPFWPAAAVEPETEDGPIQLWQVGLPWIAVLAAALMATRLAALNPTMDQFLTGLAAPLAALLACNPIL